MVAEGSFDPKTRTFNYTSRCRTYHRQVRPDPLRREAVSNDKWTMESYARTPDGKEYKSMEITYTRKK
jgi:hypothetical protein